MQCAAALSTNPSAEIAVREACDEVAGRLGGEVDLVVSFFSHAHAGDFENIPRWIQDRLRPRVALGCTGESIVGGGREIEGGPAVSLWGARLPGVGLEPVRLEFARTPEGPSILGWPDALAGDWPSNSTLLVLAEPFSFPADWLLERMNAERPGVPVVGGMASGSTGPGRNRVSLEATSYRDGAVAVLLHGDLAVRSVVSQGCRPVGSPLVVTKAEQQWIQSLGGRPPLEHIQEIFAGLSDDDRALLQRGLHVGRVVDEYRDKFSPGDFIIRNCLGAERESGAVAVGEYLRAGQTIQFHVRDAASADAELKSLLQRNAETFTPEGALLFTCNGRGMNLFDVADHDAGLVERQWPGLPLAGFFAQGEIGPVGGKNFLHGFTASLALFGRAEA